MGKELGVYLITNKTNNTFYVGSSVYVKSRISQHKALGNRDISKLTLKQLDMILHHNGLYIDMRMLGIDKFSFEIIKKDFTNIEEMHEYEQHLIKIKNSTVCGYNSQYFENGKTKNKKQILNSVQKEFYHNNMEEPLENRRNALLEE